MITLTNRANEKFILNPSYIVEVSKSDTTKDSKSAVFTINGNEFKVKETVDEIFELIDKVTKK
jgi:uncharacterized protein YlzI (FlbEa/FlbD family)